MIMNTTYISKEGLEKLKQELLEREAKMRNEIAARIAAAKELGDLSENAEYADAREAQGMNEGKIQELRDMIQNASVVESTPKKVSSVTIGSTVKAKCGKMEREFTIVGQNEADPVKGFISNETPFGVAFMGKKKGDTVKVELPSGPLACTITSVK